MWGKNKGCDFFENACHSKVKTFPEFDLFIDSYSCNFDNSGISTPVHTDYFDGCNFTSNYRNAECNDPTTQNERLKELALDIRRYDSKCFISNILQ